MVTTYRYECEECGTVWVSDHFQPVEECWNCGSFEVRARKT